MTDIDKVIENIILKHGEQPYDPAKAREYYLRNRELKGRRAGIKPLPVGRVSTSAIKRAVLTKTAPIKLSPAQRRAAQKARVSVLESKLDALKNLLAQLVKQAKARNGIVTPVKKIASRTALTDNKKASSAKLTVKQLADKAKDAKIAYDQEKDPSLKVKELSDKIAAVEEKLKDIRAKIATPIEPRR